MGKLRGSLGVRSLKLCGQYTCFLYIDIEFKLKEEIDHFFFFGGDKNTTNLRR